LTNEVVTEDEQAVRNVPNKGADQRGCGRGATHFQPKLRLATSGCYLTCGNALSAAFLARLGRHCWQQQGDYQWVVEAGVVGGPGGKGTGTASLTPAARSAFNSQATAAGLSRLTWPAGSRASRVRTASPVPASRSSLSSPATPPRVAIVDVADGHRAAHGMSPGLNPRKW
jgi:hypothetical protein